MGFLDRVTKGKTPKPPRILVYGTGGVGKTTFGADAPNAIIIGPENGSEEMENVARGPTIATIPELISALKELHKLPHEFKTLVLDSADWLESIIHDTVAREQKGATIDLAAGGFGKGYAFATNKWREILSYLTLLREERGMIIIIIAHEKTSNVTDPNTFESYQHFDLKLHQKAADLLKEWCDAVLYVTKDVLVSNKNGKVKAFSGSDDNVCYTRAAPGWAAKNRYGLPPKFPFWWKNFEEELSKARNDDATAIRGDIESLIPEIEDEDTREKVIASLAEAGNNVAVLRRYYQRVKELTKKDELNA